MQDGSHIFLWDGWQYKEPRDVRMFADLLLQEVILSTLIPDQTYNLCIDSLPERHVDSKFSCACR